MFNFDEIINRKNSNSIKHDKKSRVFGEENIIPLWISDMDFQVTPEIKDEIIKRASHEVFGYTFTPQEYFDSFINWFARRHNVNFDKNWIIPTPTVLNGVSIVVNAFTEENDGILVFTPAFSKFFNLITYNKRTLFTSDLIIKNNKYGINFEEVEEILLKGKVKVLLFCNPHNPVGRVWTKEELETLGELCIKYKVLIISDEIHGDIVLDENKFNSIYSLSNEIKNISILVSSPSKVFNTPGNSEAYTVIKNDAHRKQFKDYNKRLFVDGGTIFTVISNISAYTYGETWLNEVLIYLSENGKFIEYYLNENLPQIKYIKSEGTYLAWLDFSELGFENSQQLEEFIIKKAKLGLTFGKSFGKGYEQFARLNFATSRTVLQEALENLKRAINNK